MAFISNTNDDDYVIIRYRIGEFAFAKFSSRCRSKLRQKEVKMNYNELSLKMHEENQGKISVVSKVAVKTRDDLSTAYTPGVAEPCRRIAAKKSEVYRYTAKKNLVAVVTDGTAVLGLGDIGPEAAMPVMEGKAILFKEFGDVDAFPICLDTKDVDEIVETVKSAGYGGKSHSL